MRRADGPSTLALIARATVLLGLVIRAVVLYADAALHRRGLAPGGSDRVRESQRRFAARFVGVATRFRGGLIKLGQVASLRLDVWPEEITDELARLQDRVPPHPADEIARQIESELGAPAEECFARFDLAPLAAASLGQVHRARARDGRDLAVKVLFPGIERSVAVDLAITRLALWLFDRIAVTDLGQVYRELRDTILAEMDYECEGRAAEEIAANLSRDAELATQIRVPKIAWDLTSRRVLSMEFLDGDKINDREALRVAGISMGEVVSRASRAFLHMMLQDGFFHCDPHPGNLLVDAHGRIGIVDFGMHRRIAPEVLAAMRKNVMASVTRDAALYAESLVEMGIVLPRDVPVVIRMAELNFDPAYFNRTPREVADLDLGDYVRRMRGHLKEIRSFRLPDGIVMWSRAFSLLYGLVVDLAPGLRPLDVIGPYVVRFLAGPAAVAASAASGVNLPAPAASKPV